MPFNTLWLQNVDYPARIDRTVFDSIWTEGVLGSGSLQVSPSSPVAMSVRVAAGVAVIQGDNQVFQGKYLAREQAITSGVPISAAPGTGSRHDLVVLQVRDPNATGPAGDDAVIAVVTGTPSPSPVDPAVPASSLVLARVRVPAGTGSITSGLIDDLRVFSKDAYDTLADNSVTLTALSPTVREALAPTGSIMAFAGSTAPSGWLLCDGAPYFSAMYSALFAVIGNQYNNSAGQVSPPAGQFRVPILQGRIAVGLDPGQSEFDQLGETGGAKTVTLTDAQSGLVAHSHTVNVSGTSDPNNASHDHAQQGTFGTDGQNLDHFHPGTTAGAGGHSHSIDIGSVSSGTHGHANAANSSTAAGSPITQSSSGSKTGIINSVGNHDHVFNTGGTSNTHGHGFTLSGSTGTQSANHAHPFAGTGTANTVAGANASQAHQNLQPYIVTNYIIKI
jgi:microcystin-dependent protein